MDKADIHIGDDVFTVDSVDGTMTLCQGAVEFLNFHAGAQARVIWKNPQRDSSWRAVRALQKSPAIAICSRYDLTPDEIDAVMADAKKRGLLAE